MDRTREHRQSWSTHSCGQYKQGWAMRALAGGALAASLVLTVSVQRSTAAGTKRTGGVYEEDRPWARRGERGRRVRLGWVLSCGPGWLRRGARSAAVLRGWEVLRWQL